MACQYFPRQYQNAKVLSAISPNTLSCKNMQLKMHARNE